MLANHLRTLVTTTICSYQLSAMFSIEFCPRLPTHGAGGQGVCPKFLSVLPRTAYSLSQGGKFCHGLVFSAIYHLKHSSKLKTTCRCCCCISVTSLFVFNMSSAQAYELVTDSASIHLNNVQGNDMSRHWGIFR